MAGFDGVEHGHQGDDGLAAADVALEQAQHPPLFGHVGADFGKRAFLAGGETVGQGRRHPGPERAVACHRPSGLPALAEPDQGEGELVGQQFIEGKALAVAGGGVEPGLIGGAMNGGEGGAPVGPVLAAPVGAIEPVGQLGQVGEGGVDGLAQGLGGQAGGHGVDRLDTVDAALGILGADVIGMADLGGVVEAVDLAAHHHHLPDRELALQIVRAGMEIDQLQEPGLVGAAHLIRMTRHDRRRVAVDAHGQSRDHSRRGLGDLGREAAVDQAARQMPEQVHHQRSGQLFDQLGEARADALERPHRPEQRIEYLGPHANSPEQDEIPAVWTRAAAGDYSASHAPGDG